MVLGGKALRMQLSGKAPIHYAAHITISDSGDEMTGWVEAIFESVKGSPAWPPDPRIVS